MVLRFVIACLLAVSPALFAGKPMIRLHAGAIDPARADAQSRQSAEPSGKGRRLHLVQWDGPIQPDWVQSLAGTGVQIIDYLPDYAYLVYGDHRAIQSLRKLAAGHGRVRWNGAMLAREKIHPAASRRVEKLRRGETSERLFSVQLVHDPEANPATLALVRAWQDAPALRQRQVSHYLNLVVSLPADAVAVLANQPDVISIFPYATPRKSGERQGQIIAGNITGVGPSGPGYLAWLHATGFSQEQFNASGFVVNITDSGIDNGSTNANHFGLFVNGDTSMASRVAYNRLEGTANPGSTLQGCDGHGTINAHILAGFSDRNGFPFADSSGFRYGLGIAPFTKIGSSVIFDPDNFTFPNYSDLIARAYADGARISSDSWGSDTFGAYDAEAQEYDLLVRDAQPAGAAVATAGNQPMVIVFAAGNAGPGIQTVGSPGTAKNVITVGASEGVQSHAITNGGNNVNGTDGCTSTDAHADNLNDIVGFSSRGPTADGRKKPELVAPGTHISGGTAQSVPAMEGLGSELACYDASGICALPGGGAPGSTNNFFPLGQRWYTTSSGTSHATPAVSAAAALLRQHFINRGLPVPSPAMTKACLVSSARYLTGASANDTLWSNNQGMGGLDIGMAFDPAPRFYRDQVATDTFTASGQSRIYSVTVASNDRPFRVTLSWTDAPGSTFGEVSKNDLNLTVNINGSLYRGNVFNGSESITGGSSDDRNNTESIFLPAGTTGTASIVVSAFNINSDGVPNEGPALDQDFALVAYNATELTSPMPVASGSQLIAENCGPTNGVPDPGETVTVALAIANEGSATASNLTATLLPGNGVAWPSAPVVIGTLAPGDPPVTNLFTFTVDTICGNDLPLSLAMQEGAQDLGTVGFTFPVGSVIGITTTNANPAEILLPDFSPGIPYPSQLTVSGITGLIQHLTVSLMGIAHEFPEDMDILLVGPGGESVVLVSGAGGGTAVSALNLTLDDNASFFLPDNTPLSSGTFKPSRYYAELALVPPVPPGPYGATLSEFIGTSPNGTWSLYAMDGFPEDAGSIDSGWRLNITAGQPTCCTDNTDSDGDGMADSWETVHFGNLAAAGTNTDNDLDFIIDRHEFLSGTQPTNLTSFLQLTGGSADESNRVVVSWPGVAGKTYALSQASNLIDATFSVLATNIPGVSPLNVYTITAPPGAESTIRVGVQP